MKPPRRTSDHSPSRRRFLRQLGLGGSALAATPWLAACNGGDDTSEPGGNAGDAAGSGTDASADVAVRFAHGVASGDPLSDAVILWTRITPERAVGKPIGGAYRVATDAEFTHVVASGDFVTDAELDYTVKIDCGGLESGTSYHYRFEANGAISPTGRTLTAPVGAVDRLRIAFVSCSQYPDGYFNVYGAIARRDDVDVVLHLGDYIYEYGADQYDDAEALGRVPEPAHEIVSLSDYRGRYAQYRGDADLQALHQRHPMIAIWDDHESANDSWMHGAENHQPDSEGDWEARKAAAIRAYYEWMPIREVEAGRTERIYRQFSYGNLCDLIMLDTRLIGRDEQLPVPGAPGYDDPSRTLLGFEQEAWVTQTLARSVAQWKLLGQQVMFMPLEIGLPELIDIDLLPGSDDLPEPLDHLDDLLALTTDGGVPLNMDQWDGYRQARERLISSIRDQGLDDVVVLTGDIHTSWAQDVSEAPTDPLVYNPVTGAGSRAVEFVTPSVTSSGLPELQPFRDALRLLNPHMKYVDLESHGYILLDITAERLQGEFWYVDRIDAPSKNEYFAAAFATATGDNRLKEVTDAGSSHAADISNPAAA